MQRQPNLENETGSPETASANLLGVIPPNVAISAGAWLLTLTGLYSLFAPSTRPSAAIFRLALVVAGFALYGCGRTQKLRDASARSGGSETQQVRNLGGWLILLAVLIAVTLVSAVVQAVTDLSIIAKGQVWTAYTTPGQPAYHPGWALLLALDWGVNLFVVVFFPVLLSLFLQRKRAFRPLTIATLLFLTALSALHLYQMNAVPLVPAPAQVAQLWSLVVTLINAAIWIPYLLHSKRARVTFEL